MTSRRLAIDCGPFAETRKNLDDFCQNLFLSHAMSECALQMAIAEQEYEDAVLKKDEDLMEQKKLEMQTYQSSLTLTAYMFDEIDEIST
jgi:hypothetical protein